MTREQAVQMIENMPISHECREFFNLALDALRQPEIVRCKDCVHADCFDNYVLCRKSSEKRKEPLDWFCADGEPKKRRQKKDE